MTAFFLGPIGEGFFCEFYFCHSNFTQNPQKRVLFAFPRRRADPRTCPRRRFPAQILLRTPFLACRERCRQMPHFRSPEPRPVAHEMPRNAPLKCQKTFFLILSRAPALHFRLSRPFRPPEKPPRSRGCRPAFRLRWRLKEVSRCLNHN